MESGWYGVLAGCYTPHRRKQVYRTHYYHAELGRTMCRRQPVENLADAQEPEGTRCPMCESALRRHARQQLRTTTVL